MVLLPPLLWAYYPLENPGLNLWQLITLRITTPLLLIAIVASFFGYKKLTAGPNNWKIGGWEITKSQQYVVVAAGCMALCWLAGAGAVLFWVLGASVTVVALHASFYDSEVLAQNDSEQFPSIEQV
ncbi:Prenylated Rab acceptor protein 1 [Eumeta japonica]|uniref:PRA1 family protein n=1 Tax=Eumeta variegata TaxID=151549 RepID=A0A4C1W8E0_EUMVA|nr:Prenylated Rab acceptor protein 1 [Eumeta japonica]